jgi:hypothetical protein
MTKMSIDPADRPRVKAQCVRMLATLRLDPARGELIRSFMDAHLPLPHVEQVVYSQGMYTMTADDITFLKGFRAELDKREGERDGKLQLILRQLAKRFGPDSAQLSEQVGALYPDQLDDLGEAILDFASVDDAKTWLANAKN